MESPQVSVSVESTVESDQRGTSENGQSSKTLEEPKSNRSEIIDFESEIFEVERILKCREKSGKKWYYMKWVGFDWSENTWIPEEDLLDCPQKLAEFNKMAVKKPIHSRKAAITEKKVKLNQSDALFTQDHNDDDDEILAASNLSGELHFVIKFKASQCGKYVKARLAEKRYSKLVFNYYRKHLPVIPVGTETSFTNLGEHIEPFYIIDLIEQDSENLYIIKFKNDETEFFDSATVEQIWPNLVTSFNNEPPKIAPRDLELDQPNGFSLFLEPDLVEGVIELQDELYYLIKWKNKEIREFVKADEVENKCPKIVFEFLSKHLKWINCSSYSNGSSN